MDTKIKVIKYLLFMNIENKTLKLQIIFSDNYKLIKTPNRFLFEYLYNNYFVNQRYNKDIGIIEDDNLHLIDDCYYKQININEDYLKNTIKPTLFNIFKQTKAYKMKVKED
jgi:hypothetical protein